MERQLYRSKQNRVVAGVCGGVAEYFRIDPTLVRIIWAAVSLVYGTGVIAYIIAVIIMPENKAGYTETGGHWNEDSKDKGDEFNFNHGEWNQEPRYDPQKSRNIIGGILIVLGILLWGKTLFNWFDLKVIMPVVFIVIGCYIIYKGRR